MMLIENCLESYQTISVNRNHGFCERNKNYGI